MHTSHDTAFTVRAERRPVRSDAERPT